MAGNDAAGHGHSFAEVIGSWRHWWHNAVVATVNQAEVIATRRAECAISGRYLFMLAMSAGIAVLGLLLSSPAVVIGAMLLSPLMDPIIGLGFALATGDFGWIRQSAKSLAVGTLLAVALTALMVFFSPLQTITPEIASRTRPNLFDLLVALFSAMAGAYAMIRGREGTVVGVAIATALMPPLAVVGFGLATFNWAVFTGALMLYVTNLLTIALTAAVMARSYGFRTSLSERQTQLQTAAIVVAFIVLAVPLSISLRQIAWEARSTQKVRSELMDAFEKGSVLSQIQINWDAEPVQISATVFTPKLRPEAETASARAISREIGEPVEVDLIQSKVGPDAKAAQAAQLASARANAEAADQERVDALASRLALVAGVAADDVVIDREHRRAMVTAQPLEGTTLRGYRELEGRIAKTEPEWAISLKPPARPLPDVAFEKDEPNSDGAQAIELIAWAAQRIGAPVVLSGSAAETKRAGELLAAKGIASRSEVTRRHQGRVTVSWGAPGG